MTSQNDSPHEFSSCCTPLSPRLMVVLLAQLFEIHANHYSLNNAKPYVYH